MLALTETFTFFFLTAISTTLSIRRLPATLTTILQQFLGKMLPSLVVKICLDNMTKRLYIACGIKDDRHGIEFKYKEENY